MYATTSPQSQTQNTTTTTSRTQHGYQGGGEDSNQGDQGEYGCAGSAHPLTQGALEEALQMKVNDFSKYITVFTHKSAAAELGTQSYERYEFLGDAVCNLVVAKWLFDNFQKDEGFLTRLRTRLVSGKCFAKLASHLQLHRFVIMNHRGLRQGWQNNTRILEDVFESLIGCIYLDLGLVAAKTFLLGVMHKYINVDEFMLERNYKDQLMRYTQALKIPLPNYVVVGEPHTHSRFLVSIVVNGHSGSGSDTCKKGAEQMAAKNCLISLGVPINYVDQ